MVGYLRVSVVGDMPGGEVWSVNPVYLCGPELPPTYESLITIATAINSITVPAGLLATMNSNCHVTGVRLESRNGDGSLYAVYEAPRSVEQLLLARNPGLTLMPGAGTAETAANFIIRGSGSLNAGNKPTFYVDGIKIQNDLGGDYSVLGQTRSPLDAITTSRTNSAWMRKRGPRARKIFSGSRRIVSLSAMADCL